MNEALKLIVFSLDKQSYGLPLHAITKVLRAVEVTPLPKALSLILGVVNVHDEVIPVLDIRNFLGLNQKAIGLSDCFIATQISSRTLIFVVDSVLNMTEYFTNEIVPVDCFFPKNAEHIKGILKKDNDLIFILDIEKLISRNDFQEIEKLAVKGSRAT